MMAVTQHAAGICVSQASIAEQQLLEVLESCSHSDTAMSC
jgi:hypothetical protein